MAIKKFSDNPEKAPVNKVSIDDIPDFFGDDDSSSSGIQASPSPAPDASMASALQHDAASNPCYGQLASQPPTGSHWLAFQVYEEVKVAMSGLSAKQMWWCEKRANILAALPFGLETAEDQYCLSWRVDPGDLESRLMLQDIREHLRWVFGPSFIVRPVGELSANAQGWVFSFRG